MDQRQLLGLALVVGALLASRRSRAGSSGPTEHFTWDELTTTSTGLDNWPDDSSSAWDNLTALAEEILEPIRDAFGPVTVNSAYRSEQVNEAVGGSSTSEHLDGLAADIKVNGYTHEDIAEWCWDNEDLPIGECIVERHTGHLHISFDRSARREFLQTYDGKSYSSWSP